MGAYPGTTLAGPGTASPIILNLQSGWNRNNISPYSNPSPNWALGIICTVSPGANLTYSVQVTGDQIPSANGNWNNHDSLNGNTTSANGNIAFPITGIRLVVTSYTNGSVNMAVVQWP